MSVSLQGRHSTRAHECLLAGQTLNTCQHHLVPCKSSAPGKGTPHVRSTHGTCHAKEELLQHALVIRKILLYGLAERYLQSTSSGPVIAQVQRSSRNPVF